MIKRKRKLKKEILKDITEERWSVHTPGDELSEQDRKTRELSKSFGNKKTKKPKGR